MGRDPNCGENVLHFMTTHHFGQWDARTQGRVMLLSKRHYSELRSRVSEVCVKSPKALQQLGSLPGLKRLRLQDLCCRGDWSRVEELRSLQTMVMPTQLVALELRRVAVLGPPSLLMLTHLTALTLNTVSMQDFTFLAELVWLEHLQIINSYFTDMPWLRPLTRLSTLRLELLPGLRELAFLAECTSLLKLEVIYCLGLKDLTPLTALQRLDQLRLQGLPVTDLGPLAALSSSLVSLSLDCKGITNLAPVAQLTRLVDLSISGRKITSMMLSPLAAMTQLTSLWLWGTSVMDLGPLVLLPRLRIKCSDCQYLDTHDAHPNIN